MSMMDFLWLSLKFMLWGWVVVGVLAVIWWVWFRVSDLQQARTEIFAYVEGYKKRCTGNNRFIVTVETLQDAFREYDTPTINKIWLELIKERVIEQDPLTHDWCIR
jgi:hypothetical protein